MDDKQFVLDKSFLLKPRKLIFAKDCLRFIKDDDTNYIELKNGNIKDFRFGIRYIKGLYFYIRRIYQIDIRDTENKEIKITKKCFNRIGVNNAHKLYADILNSLYEFYFDEMVEVCYNKYLNKQSFSICDMEFSENGIGIVSNRISKGKNILIDWTDVGVRYYTTNLTIFSKSDAANVNRGFYYLTDWNTGVLYSLFKKIIKE